MIKKNTLNFAIFSLPLAFVGLPIYINVTDFYIRNFEVNIAYLAFVILFVRLLDGIQEPILGLLSDYLIKRKFSHKKIIYFSSVFLAISFFGLFNPPIWLKQNLVLIWVFILMTTTYSFYNLCLINFEALAVVIAHDSAQRVEVNSYKEFFGLIGIIIASASPQLISLITKNNGQNYFYLSIIFVILLFFSIIFFLRNVTEDQKILSENFNIKNIIKEIFKDKIFIKLMIIFFINSLAVSLPASVITFFVSEILYASDKIGYFLVVYFLSAGIFVYFWKKIIDRIGKIPAWRISIIGSVITFVFAYFINGENYHLFYIVCFLSGVFLGADLIIPPALIAEVVHKKTAKITSYISFWSMINKAGLMFASFFTLISLSIVDFNPQDPTPESLLLIPILYAIIPCALKIIVVLFISKSEKFKNL
jgi:Na+/melibiose symporter-like transporter